MALWDGEVSFSFPQAKAQPVGVAAQPPRAVSRSSAGIFLPTEYMVSSISSKGMIWRMPLRAISAAVMAMAAPAALRPWQGHSTRPPMGSQTSPSMFMRTEEAADRHCSGVPPMSSAAAEAAHQAVVGDAVFLLQGQDHSRHDAGGTGGGSGDDQAHGGVHLQNRAGVGDGPGDHVPADGLAGGPMFI